MQMSCNHPLRCCGAAALQRTAAAGLRRSRVHDASISARELFPPQRFPSRTAEGIAAEVIDEEAAVEQRAVPLVVHSTVGGNMRHDAPGLAPGGLLPVGVARIGHHVQCFRIPQRCFGRLSHGQQAAIVRRFGSHLLGNDQRVFGEQIARIVAGSPGLGRLSANKSQLFHLQPLNERLDHPANVIGRNQFIQRRWKQRVLPPRFSLYVCQRKCPRSREGIFPSQSPVTPGLS